MRDGQTGAELEAVGGRTTEGLLGLTMDKPAPANALTAIHEAVRARAIRSSARTLLAWGAINLVAWFLFNGELLGEMGRILSQPGGAALLAIALGGAIIGVIMLALGIYGLVSRAPITIVLDGIGLIVVGAWNLGSDALLNAVLRSHGYDVAAEATNPRWMVMGGLQIIYGLREFLRYSQITKPGEGYCDKEEVAQATTALEQFVKKPADPVRGRLAGLVHQSGLLGHFNREENFVGLLCRDCAIFVSTGLREWVCVPRTTAADGKFGKDGAMTVTTTDGPREMKLKAASAVAFKQWAGVPLTAADVKLMVSQKDTPREILESLIGSNDQEVAEAASEAFAKLRT